MSSEPRQGVIMRVWHVFKGFAYLVAILAVLLATCGSSNAVVEKRIDGPDTCTRPGHTSMACIDIWVTSTDEFTISIDGEIRYIRRSAEDEVTSGEFEITTWEARANRYNIVFGDTIWDSIETDSLVMARVTMPRALLGT